MRLWQGATLRTRYALAFCMLSVVAVGLIAFSLTVFVYVGLLASQLLPGPSRPSLALRFRIG